LLTQQWFSNNEAENKFYTAAKCYIERDVSYVHYLKLVSAGRQTYTSRPIRLDLVIRLILLYSSSYYIVGISKL
jgi:hypothetical protein